MTMEDEAKESSGSQEQPSRGDVAAKERAFRREAEHLAKEAGELWRQLVGKMRKPSIGATVAGAAVLAAGAVWGASEAAIAALGAYVVFRMLRKRERSEADGEQKVERVETERGRSTP